MVFIQLKKLPCKREVKISLHWFYRSSAQSFHTTVCEGSTKSIQCPLGRRINIPRAMYGRLNKKICPLNNHTSTNQCKSRSSLKKTKEICDGKMSSVLSANNNIYGDPCVSVYKYLQIRYRCVWWVSITIIVQFVLFFVDIYILFSFL